MRQAPGLQRAAPAVPLGPLEDHRAIAVRTVVLAGPVQPLARRADAGQALRVEAKVFGPKEPRGIVRRLGLMPLGGDKARVALAKQRVGQIAVDVRLVEVLHVRVRVEARGRRDYSAAWRVSICLPRATRSGSSSPAASASR